MMFGTKEERNEAIKNPKFVYVTMQCWDKHQGNDGGFVLQWGVEHLGFGEIAFYKKGSVIKCDTETMGKEFVQKALEHFLSTVEFDYE